MSCNPHPSAPHGFLRGASHAAGRYVCECEAWDEDEPLPCPFCGHSGIHVREGSTFRYVIAECNNCGAAAGEVRIDTLINRGEAFKQGEVKAIKEWNTRYDNTKNASAN